MNTEHSDNLPQEDRQLEAYKTIFNVIPKAQVALPIHRNLLSPVMESRFTSESTIALSIDDKLVCVSRELHSIHFQTRPENDENIDSSCYFTIEPWTTPGMAQSDLSTYKVLCCIIRGTVNQ